MMIHKQKIMFGFMKFLLVAQTLRWMVTVTTSEPLILRWIMIIVILSEDGKSNIDSYELYVELKFLQDFVPKENIGPC